MTDNPVASQTIPGPSARDTRSFMAAIMRRPGQVGAIAPSSRGLARRLADPIPRAGAPVVVELGPGGGVVTDEIHRLLPAGGRLAAVEVNDDMARHLRRTRPWLHVIPGDARELTALLAPEGITRADVVVATLPWTLFADDDQELILTQIAALLAPTGVLTTLLTLPAVPMPAARRFRRRLDRLFGRVTTTGPLWWNVPPALAYACRRPAAAAA